MPYTKPPKLIQSLPQEAKNIWVRVFNEAYKRTKNDNLARQAAWGAVKKSYKKINGKWVKKSGD